MSFSIQHAAGFMCSTICGARMTMCVLCPRPECYVTVNIHEKPKTTHSGNRWLHNHKWEGLALGTFVERGGNCRFIHLVLEGTEVKLYAESQSSLITDKAIDCRGPQTVLSSYGMFGFPGLRSHYQDFLDSPQMETRS
ncbi:hypothetical protein I7I48_10012 [Histoplasma ohiense]|nr:hypothetical protein I7I48_10012 [Histoplasma ohiense (nom. inval.)]